MEAEATAAAAAASAAAAPRGKGKDAAASAEAAARAQSSSGLRVLRMSAPGFSRSVKQAVQLGLPVLIENVGETLEPFIDPLLLHQARGGGRR